MTAQPAWFHRLDEIIARLEETAASGVFQREGTRRARVVDGVLACTKDSRWLLMTVVDSDTLHSRHTDPSHLTDAAAPICC